ACANLANLMLARASAREREMALRMTLGASRGRLIQQMLVESLLLATVGAAAGAALAQVLSKLMVGFISSEDNPIFLPLSADWRFLLFTTMLGVLTCLLCGTAPALQAARSDPGYALKGSGRGSTAGRRGLAVRRGLVVSQVALSLVLLVTALLFVRTFTNLVSVNAGLRQDGVLVADFDFSPLKMLAGRDFDERDTLNSPPAAIVNERFAREVLGGSNPLGVTFYVARGKPEERIYQIVGLVGNTKYRDVREQFQPIIFLAESQDAK